VRTRQQGQLDLRQALPAINAVRAKGQRNVWVGKIAALSVIAGKAERCMGGRCAGLRVRFPRPSSLANGRTDRKPYASRDSQHAWRLPPIRMRAVGV
jgi:hypothetical protein